MQKPAISVDYAFDAVRRAKSPLLGEPGALSLAGARAPSPAGARPLTPDELLFSVTVTAPFDDGARARVAFVIFADASGSMESMDPVVAATAFVLERLAPGDYFALLVFSDGVRVLAPPQAWTAAGAAAAVQRLAACPAEGRTNLAAATTEAIAAAVAMVKMAAGGAAPEFISPIIIGITDGHPTEEFGGPLEVVRRVLRQGDATAAAQARRDSDSRAGPAPAKRPRLALVPPSAFACEHNQADLEIGVAELEDAAPKVPLSMIGIGTDFNERLLELMVRAGGGGVSVALTDFSAEGLSAALGAIVGGAASVTHPDTELSFEPSGTIEFAWERNGRVVGAQAAGAPAGAPGGPPMAGGPAGSFTARLPPMHAGAAISGLLRVAARRPPGAGALSPGAFSPARLDPAPGMTLGRVWANGQFGCVFSVVRLPARTSRSPAPDPLARWLARRPALLAAIRGAIAARSDDAGAAASLAPTLAELTTAPLLGYGPADQLATLVRELQAGPAAGDAGFVAHAYASLSQRSGASFSDAPPPLFARTMSQGL